MSIAELGVRALDQIRENQLVRRISERLPRAEASRNAHQETDAELVEVGLAEQLLAITTDSVVDEIALGLYQDPYEIGWVAVVASLSDLAAVGASPLGVVSSLSLASAWSQSQCDALLEGMADALRAHRTGVLGGDTNWGAASVNVTAVGIVSKSQVLRRTGAQLHDEVFVSSPCGAGSLLALQRFAAPGMPVTPFRPTARLDFARTIAGAAHCCIDTSDGLVGALDQLQRSNRVVIQCEDLSRAIAAPVQQAFDRASLPGLASLCGLHGEFELCFTIPGARVAEMRTQAERLGLSPVLVGKVVACDTDASGLNLANGWLDSGQIRNLWHESSSPREYIASLVRCVHEAQTNDRKRNDPLSATGVASQ